MKLAILLFIFILFAQMGGCQFGRAPVAERNSTPAVESTPLPKSKSTELTGKVVHISDGDTFIIESAKGERATIRIHAIDAPELSQTFGKDSRENLRAQIANQQVEIHEYNRDQFHRVVGSVFLNGKDMGLEQVKGGFAWHFKQYQKEQPQDERAAYSAAEDAAKNSRLGLWRDGNAQNPQDYRRTHDMRR